MPVAKKYTEDYRYCRLKVQKIQKNEKIEETSTTEKERVKGRVHVCSLKNLLYKIWNAPRLLVLVKYY